MSENSTSSRSSINMFVVLKNVLIIFLVASPVLGYIGISMLAQTISPVDKNPYVHWNGLNPSESVYISWESGNEEQSFVMYGTDQTFSESPVSDSTKENMHHVVLTGLTSNTKYYYRAGSSASNLIDGVFTFTTAPTPSESAAFNFTLLSDTQQMWGTGHYDTISDAIASEKHGDTSFLIDVGDLGQEPDDVDTWNFFMDNTNKFSGHIPMVPCLGNHDIRREQMGLTNNLYTKYFDQTRPDGKGYYAFNWSTAFFAVLHIAEGGDENPNSEFAIEHDIWLNESLEAAQSQDYRFLMFHRQLYSSIGNSETLINRLIPIIEKYNVSMVFYGHKHQYERFIVDGTNLVCLGGGGGMQNTLSNEQEWTQIMAMGASFTRIFIDGDTLKLKTLSPTFDIMDEATFVKQGNKLVLQQEEEN